ncbi:MAG: hypothetical protein IJ087_05565 [Eggerthellaceae bacterium]|nr:hypothetical protein [Eggerthellaceae bacterium]
MNEVYLVMPFVFTSGNLASDTKRRLIFGGIREERAAAARRNGLAGEREENARWQ